MTVIYHGTPMTPRAALLNVCAGRAMCVSYFRPDDVEAVEAISPDIMFRQRRVFDVESGAAARRGMVREMGLVRLFHVAGATPFSPRTMGGYPRYAGGAEPAQRRTFTAMALRTEGRATVAYGRANRAIATAMRTVRPRLSWVDRRRQALGPARISRPNARGRSGFGQPLAGSSHDARDQGCLRLSLRQRGRYNTSTKRVAL